MLPTLQGHRPALLQTLHQRSHLQVLRCPFRVLLLGDNLKEVLCSLDKNQPAEGRRPENSSTGSRTVKKWYWRLHPFSKIRIQLRRSTTVAPHFVDCALFHKGKNGIVPAPGLSIPTSNIGKARPLISPSARRKPM